MKEQATRLWGWMRHHRGWAVFMLIVLLVGLGFGTFWMVNLVRFGLPPPIGQNCGSLPPAYHYYEDQSVPAAETLQQLGCFWQAYQTCEAATIGQTRAGTDVGSTDTLTIEWRNNHCAIYGHEDYWVNTKSGSGTFLCTQLSKEGDDLQVWGCDGADSITLYARDATYESYRCGIVNSDTPYDYRTPQEMETCFFAAYQQCLADSLEYFASVNAVETERDFYIDNHCRIAYWRGNGPPSYGTKLADCAILESRADGLHFLQCGTDGDISVPSSSSP